MTYRLSGSNTKTTDPGDASVRALSPSPGLGRGERTVAFRVRRCRARVTNHSGLS